MRFGYANGYKDGEAAALNHFERVLAILREEMADARRERDYQSSRADSACDLLLQHLGARAISLAGKQEEVDRVDRKIRVVEKLASIPDPTEDLPYGDPRGQFKSAKDAALFGGEDVATAEG